MTDETRASADPWDDAEFEVTARELRTAAHFGPPDAFPLLLQMALRVVRDRVEAAHQEEIDRNVARLLRDHEAEIAELLWALEEATTALEVVLPESLGIGHTGAPDDPGATNWYLRDELVGNLRALIAKYKSTEAS